MCHMRRRTHLLPELPSSPLSSLHPHLHASSIDIYRGRGCEHPIDLNKRASGVVPLHCKTSHEPTRWDKRASIAARTWTGLKEPLDRFITCLGFRV